MWGRFEKEAEKLESTVRRWAATPATGRLAILDLGTRCIASRDVLINITEEIAASAEPMTAKIAALRTCMAPLRKACNFLTDALQDSSIRRENIIQMGCIVAFPLGKAIQAVVVPGSSLSSVSFSNMKFLVDSFSFLEPLARCITEMPLQWWPVPDAGLNDHLPSTVLQLVILVRSASAIFVKFVREHPRGQRLVRESAPLLEGLAKVMWAMGPIISKDIGLCPKDAHHLALEWAQSYNYLQRLAMEGDCVIPQDVSGAVPTLTRLLRAIAAAAGDTDLEARMRAYAGAEVHVLESCFAVIGLQKYVEPAGYTTFCITAGTRPDDAQRLLDAVQELRAAAAVPGDPIFFTLNANMLAFVACALAGGCLYHAAGSTLEDQLAVLCGEPFIKCITTSASAWSVMARRSSEAPAFDFWADGGSAMLVFAQFSGVCCEMATAAQQMREIRRSDESRAMQFAPLMTGSLTAAVRGLADLSDSISAFPAFSVANTATMGRRVGLSVSDISLARATVDSICRAGFGFVSAAVYKETRRCGGSVPAIIADIGLTSHICLHTSLAVRTSGQWEGAELEISPTTNAVGGWCAIASILYCLMRDWAGQNEEATLAVALHYLVALASLPYTINNIEHELIILLECAAALKGVLLPTDVPGLEKLLQHCGQPDAVAGLRELLEAAKSTDDLEQRQRRRLDLLVGGLPPGSCHNLRCNVALPPEKLLKCSGCMLAKYCSSSCSKFDWKHGHKAACRAVQSERDGG